MTEHDGGASCGLEAEHARHLRRCTALQFFAVAPEVCSVVTGIADWKEVKVRRVAENLDDFERCGLLPLDAVWVDRIHQVHRVVLGKIACEIETVVEVALYLK